jgi:hypothetical protein
MRNFYGILSALYTKRTRKNKLIPFPKLSDELVPYEDGSELIHQSSCDVRESHIR